MKHNLNAFVRFGGLNIIKQKGFGKNTYHAPPATRGFFAMPLVAQELFLVGCLDVTQPGTMPKTPKPKEDVDIDWVAFNKKYKRTFSTKRKQFIKTKGTIWHHLSDYIERNEIIAEHNSWVKTSISTWQKAFSKMSLKHRYGEKDPGFDFSIKSINEPIRSGLLGIYSKDHCEVFFDEKV